MLVLSTIVVVQSMATRENPAAHCKHYHTKVFSRQKIQTEFLGKTFSLNVWPPTDFPVVTLSVIDDMITFCFATTAMIVALFNIACTE